MSYNVVLESYQESRPDEGVTSFILHRATNYKKATEIRDSYIKALESLGFRGINSGGFRSKQSSIVYSLEIVGDYECDDYTVAEFISYIKDYMDE